MARRFLKSASHGSLVRIALLAFTLRALVPLGYMPSMGHPLTLSICPDGLPVEFLPHARGDHSIHDAGAGNTHHHAAAKDPAESGSHDHELDHCAFAALAGSAFVTVSSVTVPAPELTTPKIDFHADTTRSSEPFLLDRIRGPPLA
jgi:hypothetical protein